MQRLPRWALVLLCTAYVLPGVFGRDPWRNAVELHRQIAYVPGDVTLWPTLTGGETIDLLARMRLALPDIQVELVSSNGVSNLLRREADIAVRIVEGTADDGDVHGERLVAEQFLAIDGDEFSGQELLALGQAGAVEYVEKQFAGPAMSDDEWASL